MVGSICFELFFLSLLIVFLIARSYCLGEDYDRLARAIKKHRAQKADDRCIEDDDELYEALGDGIKCDRKVGNKEEMLANCKRFIENRCEGGKWPSYAELEKERNRYFNMAVEYDSKLYDWIEFTGCSNPSECRKKLGLPEL